MNLSTRVTWLLGWLSLAIGSAAVAAEGSSAAQAVRLDGERLSLRVERLPLGELLAALERSGRVRIDVHGDASGVTVSDSFDDADVAHALRRVLSAHSHVLIDRGASQGAARVIGLILFSSPPGGVAGPAQESDRPASSSAPLASAAARAPADVLANAALSATSGAERAAAAEELAYRSDPEQAGYADQVLVQQLSDPDERVRSRALETLKDTAETVPVDALAQVAREDMSAERRIQALELLAERAERKARGPLRHAEGDSSPAVRARAQELMQDWDLNR